MTPAEQLLLLQSSNPTLEDQLLEAAGAKPPSQSLDSILEKTLTKTEPKKPSLLQRAAKAPMAKPAAPKKPEKVKLSSWETEKKKLIEEKTALEKKITDLTKKSSTTKENTMNPAAISDIKTAVNEFRDLPEMKASDEYSNFLLKAAREKRKDIAPGFDISPSLKLLDIVLNNKQGSRLAEGYTPPEKPDMNAALELTNLAAKNNMEKQKRITELAKLATAKPTQYITTLGTTQGTEQKQTQQNNRQDVYHHTVGSQEKPLNVGGFGGVSGINAWNRHVETNLKDIREQYRAAKDAYETSQVSDDSVTLQNATKRSIALSKNKGPLSEADYQDFKRWAPALWDKLGSTWEEVFSGLPSIKESEALKQGIKFLEAVSARKARESISSLATTHTYFPVGFQSKEEAEEYILNSFGFSNSGLNEAIQRGEAAKNERPAASLTTRGEERIRVRDRAKRQREIGVDKAATGVKGILRGMWK